MLPDPAMLPSCEEVKLDQSGFKRPKKCTGKKKKIGSRKGCFKYSAPILSPPSLHLQSTTQNALLQMGCTPRPHPPMTYL